MSRAAYRRCRRDQGMQERSASRARPPHVAARLGPARGVLEHVVGLGPQLVLDRLEHLRGRPAGPRVVLDPLAHGIGGMPQLLAPRARAGRTGAGRLPVRGKAGT